MPSTYTSRTSITSSYSSRDPIGIVYLVDDDGNILTDDFGEGLYISQQNSQYTSRPPVTSPGGLFKISSTGFFKINTSDLLETQADYPYSLYISRTPI